MVFEAPPKFGKHAALCPSGASRRHQTHSKRQKISDLLRPLWENPGDLPKLIRPLSGLSGSPAVIKSWPIRNPPFVGKLLLLLLPCAKISLNGPQTQEFYVSKSLNGRNPKNKSEFIVFFKKKSHSLALSRLLALSVFVVAPGKALGWNRERERRKLENHITNPTSCNRKRDFLPTTQSGKFPLLQPTRGIRGRAEEKRVLSHFDFTT